MERTDATTQEQVYHPRNPRASPLYRYVCEHADELREAGHIHRRVEEEPPVIERKKGVTI